MVWLVVLQALEGSGWLNGLGLAAFEGGATAFGQAFHSHKPSQTQNGGALSWFMVARNVVFENLVRVAVGNLAGLLTPGLL